MKKKFQNNAVGLNSSILEFESELIVSEKKNTVLEA